MVWEPVATPPALGPTDVHVWRARLDESLPQQTACRAALTSHENARADEYLFDEPRQRFIAARGTLRILLGRYLSVSPREVEFVYGEHGKPRLAQPVSDLTFNVSHSGKRLLLAFGRERELGVDVERTRRDVSWERVARRFFDEREATALFSLPEEERRQAFFRCWTRKEAYMKATGHGVALGLSSFAVSLAPDRAELVWMREGEPADWGLTDVDVGDGYAGALCAAGAGWTSRWLRTA
jgi:4'-phosphopantetheinyl transferase